MAEGVKEGGLGWRESGVSSPFGEGSAQKLIACIRAIHTASPPLSEGEESTTSVPSAFGLKPVRRERALRWKKLSRVQVPQREATSRI
jgi:hypothetical protein